MKPVYKCAAKNFIVVSNGDRRQVVLTHLIPYAVLGDTTLAGEDIDDLVCSTVEVAAPEVKISHLVWINLLSCNSRVLVWFSQPGTFCLVLTGL